MTAAAALQEIIQLSESALVVLSRADNLLLPSPVLLFTFPPPPATAATPAAATAAATSAATAAAATAAAAAAAEELIVAEQQQQQQMRRIQNLCAQHGPIVRTAVVQADETAATGSQLFVQFLSPQAAAKARILLTCPPPIPVAVVTALEKNFGSESSAEKGRCLYAQSPPRNMSDAQRGFLSEYYPLELWYKYVV
jgi:hypothetical protein